jgi:hypothetical protein
MCDFLVKIAISETYMYFKFYLFFFYLVYLFLIRSGRPANGIMAAHYITQDIQCIIWHKRGA